MTRISLIARLTNAATVPWNAFVAAFLYYTVLAAVLLGGGRVGGPMVATAYLAPALAYGVRFVLRMGRAVVATGLPSLAALPRGAR